MDLSRSLGRSARRGVGAAVGLLLATSSVLGQPGTPATQKPVPSGFASERPDNPARSSPAALPVPAAGQSSAAPAAVEPLVEAPSRLDDLVQAAIARHPRLARATFAVEAAQGRTVQAGLYPNPVLSVTADELGDRQGRAGIITAPLVSQEIVRGGKLRLSQAVAAREADQATLAVLAERYAVISAVRTAYVEAYVLQRRIDLLESLAKLADQSAKSGKTLFDQGLLAELDFLQLEIEQERVRANLESARKELSPSLRRLAAVVGEPDLPVVRLADSLPDQLPEYQWDDVRSSVSATHPTARSAKVAVERAQLAVRRAEAENTPNVTVQGGYVRQNQNRSNDYVVGVSLPLPTWNRNQGNILAAQAEVGAASRDVKRVELELVERVSGLQRAYASARETAERYTKAIIPRAEKSYSLSAAAFKGGQFEYLRVLQAQRALAEARLEALRATGEAWKASGELSGLSLEETWPPAAQPKPEIPGSSQKLNKE